MIPLVEILAEALGDRGPLREHALCLKEAEAFLRTKGIDPLLDRYDPDIDPLVKEACDVLGLPWRVRTGY